MNAPEFFARALIRRVDIRARRAWARSASHLHSGWAKMCGATIDPRSAFRPRRVEGDWHNLIVEREAAVGQCRLLLLAPITISTRAIINDDVQLLTGTHDVSDPHFALQVAPIFVSAYAWVCTGAMILPGVTIGEGAVVAAGAVVAKDVPPWTIVGGNPAKKIGERSSRDLNYVPGSVDYLHP